MDFFEAQDRARRRSGRLVLLFAVAVLGLVVATNLFLGIFIGWFSPGVGPYPAGLSGADPTQLPWDTHLWVSAAVLLVVALGTGWRWLSLRQGGRAVAEAMGGRLVPQSSDDPDERRALNVVAEMAIASGVPVPPLYVVDSHGINAFAAGHGAEDMVVALTRGALRALDRDELQGVVGHEFSHLLHGDVRLNLRLVAVLYGITCIGLVGEALARGGGRGRGRKNAAVLGLGLMALGWAGTLCGQLIRAAVSRQREYLADASAVQYTRNPEGIANALKKIGGAVAGSQVAGAAAEEVSHMWFGASRSRRLPRLFATHPPLPERIRALQPDWDGQFLSSADAADLEQRAEAFAAMFANTDDPFELRPAAPAAGDVLDMQGTVPSDSLAAALAAGATEPAADDVAAAREDLDQLPAVLDRAAADPGDARAVACAVLLASCVDAGTRRSQADALAAADEPRLDATTRRLLPLVDPLGPHRRRQLLALALPSLKSLSTAQHRRFLAVLLAMVRADGRIDLREWCLYHHLRHALTAHAEGARPPRARLRRVSAAPNACAEVLAALARAGHDDPSGVDSAWRAGMAQLDLDASGAMPGADPDCRRLAAAVARLRTLYPLARPALLKACVTAVEDDHLVTAEQTDLLAALAILLDCPLPPHVLDG